MVQIDQITNIREQQKMKNEVEGIQGACPKNLLGGSGPQNLLTMVIILPPSAAVSPPPIN